MSFQCTIVTPEAQLLDASVSQVILPAHDGQIGIQTGRAPLLVKLGVGPLRVDLANGQKQLFLVDGGIAQMKDNKLTLLTNGATPQSQLDSTTAQAELAEATARKITDEKSFNQRQHDLAKARAAKALATK